MAEGEGYELPKCPECGSEVKKVLKEWKMKSGKRDFYWIVRRFQCELCEKKFNVYYRDGKIHYIIKK